MPHTAFHKRGMLLYQIIQGATSEDIIQKIKPVIKKKPDLIIIHIGTNDVTKNVDTIINLQTIINRVKKKSATTEIVISSILQRHDRPSIENKVTTLNQDIKTLCDENLIRYLCNVNESCLAKGKLHPNKKGNSYLANKLYQDH